MGSDSHRWDRFRRSADRVLRDLGARLRGRCNRAPMFMVDGGYHSWRCGLDRGHRGPCRTGNYWWGPGGGVFDAVSPPAPAVTYRDGQSRRQRESRRRWHDLQDKRREVEALQAAAVVAEAEQATATFKPTDEGLVMADMGQSGGQPRSYRKKPVVIQAMRWDGSYEGEFYPCKPDIFEQTYEEADDGR